MRNLRLSELEQVPEIMTLDQAADYIQSTPHYLARMIKLGRLKRLKPTGKFIRIRRSDLELFLESQDERRN